MTPRARAVYAAIVVFVTVLAGFVGSLAYTNHVDQRRAASDRRNAEEQRKTAEQLHAAVCRVVNANIDSDRETPPQTASGKNKAAAWQELRGQFGC